MNQLWFVSRGQQMQGPFSPAQLREEVKAGRLQPQHLLRLQENKNWVKAASIKGLFPTTTALTASPAVSKNPPAAQAAAPAAKTSSSKTGIVIAALAVGSVLLLLVMAAGVFATVYLFRSTDSNSSRVADASTNITSAEPARAEAGLQNNSDAIGEPKEGPRPDAPVLPKEAPRPAGPVGPKDAPRPSGPVGPKDAPRPADRAQPKAAPPAAAGSDVIALAKLLSQDVIVGATEYRRPPDAEWISAVKKLRSSSDPAVAAAVKAMTAPEGTVTGRAFAVTYAMKARAESREKLQKLVDSGHGNLTGFLDKWADDEQLNEAVKAGFMTRSEADAYAAARGGAQADTNATWFTILSNAAKEKIVEDQVRAIRKIAELMEGHVFVEHLVDALRARAGAKAENAPLDFKIGGLPDRSNNGEELGLLCGASTADRELTNLTLLLAVQGPLGSRYVAVFMPRLGPAELFRLLPFALGSRELRASSFKQPPEEALGRYSIWCDQFTLENQPLPEAATKDGNFAYAAQAVLTNRAFIGKPGGLRSGNPLLETRFGITFTDVKPKGDGYQIKAQLDRYDLADKTKIAGSETLAGTLHKSPSPKGRAGPVVVAPDALCDLQGRGIQMHFQIGIPPDGELYLDAKGYPFEGRNWVPAEEVKKSDAMAAAFPKQNALLRQAHELVKKGQKEEAAKIAKDVLADSPSPVLEREAKDLLKELGK